MNLLAKLQNIDRRVLYLLLTAVIAVPLLVRPSRHPHVIFSEVENAYATIDAVPEDKIVIVSTVWSAGTSAENRPQTEAVMRHMFDKGIKFVVISWDAVGAELTYDVGLELEKELGKEYGKDWVHVGYRIPQIYAVVSGMAEDFQGVMEHDRFKTKLSEIPVTKHVKNHEQIGAVIEITPSGTVGSWIAYFNMPYHVPLVYCPTAVMAAEAYPFLDSGQMAGMVNGVIGAAQYETLIGRENERTYAAAASWALSSAHVFIILLIILGNIGYLAARRSGRGGGGGMSRG